MDTSNVRHWTGGPGCFFNRLLQMAGILAVLTAMVVTTGGAVQGGQASSEWLRVEGNQIVNESGETVLLRGANIVRYNWKYPDSRAMELDIDVASMFTRSVQEGGWGANSFTLWVDSNPVLDDNAEYMEWLDGMVDAAKENDAYVILAWHADEGLERHPERISEKGFQAMASVARRYRDVPNVLYATQAEPGFWTSSTSRWRELRDQQEQMIDSIRAENSRALIGVAGTSWSQEVDWMLDDPVRRDNIFVKPHLYAPMSGVMDERRIPEIAERWPVVIGEFGTGGRMNDDDSQRMIRYADEHLSGWQAWNMSDEGPPLMLRSHQDVTPSTFGQMVKTELARGIDPEPVSVPLRINVGGDRVEDTAGNLWLADQEWWAGASWGHLPGSGNSTSHDVEVAEADDAALFATERWGLEAYHVRLPDGIYDIRLHFAESFEGIDGPGQRVFDVEVEGQSLDQGLDLFAEAGASTAVVREMTGIEVKDGVLEVRFIATAEEPILNALEVLPAGAH